MAGHPSADEVLVMRATHTNLDLHWFKDRQGCWSVRFHDLNGKQHIVDTHQKSFPRAQTKAGDLIATSVGIP